MFYKMICEPYVETDYTQQIAGSRDDIATKIGVIRRTQTSSHEK